ncbi:MAG: ATP-binding cassette domain-containing protein, partial [Methanobrevibacter sp.]|nr:ATP-binding cassette domain-containing protein [Methanobrevibacter sp.]
INYGLKVRDMEKEVSPEDISNILEKVGLEGYENQKASTMSGGEIQRLAFARALIVNPEILLLDEPTANLDPETTERIGKLIQDIRENEDTAIVMATHNLILGQKLCDEIAIINKKIYQFGKTENLFKKPDNKFVAEFVGMGNIQKGVVRKREGNLTLVESNHLNILSKCDFQEGKKVYVGTRPEDITVTKEKIDDGIDLNQFKGKVLDYHYNGALVDLKIDIGEQFSVYLTKKSFLDLKVNIGSDMWIQFKPESVHLFDYK